MVVVVSPRWEYWLEVVTVRVTLHEVRQMAATIAQNSKQNAVRVIKCFVIFVLFFRVVPAGGAESLISVTSVRPPAGAEQSPQTIIYSSFDFCSTKLILIFRLCKYFETEIHYGYHFPFNFALRVLRRFPYRAST